MVSLGTQVTAPAPSVKWVTGCQQAWMQESEVEGMDRDPRAEVLGYRIDQHHVGNLPKVANGSFLSCRSLSTLI